jgi:hypothetical protein
VDGAGRPVEGAVVMGWVLLRVPAAEASPAALLSRYPGGGLTTVRRGGGEEVALVLHHFGRTGADGTFRLDLRERGEVRLLVLPPGGAPLLRRLDAAPPEPDALDLTAEPAARPGAVVLVVQGGRPLAGARIAVSDQTDPDVKPGWVAEADAEGRIAAEWFVAGRTYAFTLLPAGEGAPAGRTELRWEDQGEIRIPRPCRR